MRLLILSALKEIVRCGCGLDKIFSKRGIFLKREEGEGESDSQKFY